MKKILIIMAAFVWVLGITVSARASLITITFDEPGITADPPLGGPTGNRYDGTQIDDEYSAIGVTWEDTLPANASLTGQGVTRPSEFSGDWTDSDQMLWYYGTGGGGTTPVNAPILLNVPANSFAFEYRRPNNYGTMGVQLYRGNGLVYDDPGLSWDIGEGWKTFTYTGKLFDQIVISGSDKFVSDNYSLNMVPIPSAFWLLGSGLVLVIHRRRKN